MCTILEENKRMQCFGRETWKKEGAWDTKRRWEDTANMDRGTMGWGDFWVDLSGAA
jgi:hypothetical protein